MVTPKVPPANWNNFWNWFLFELIRETGSHSWEGLLDLEHIRILMIVHRAALNAPCPAPHLAWLNAIAAAESLLSFHFGSSRLPPQRNPELNYAKPADCADPTAHPPVFGPLTDDTPTFLTPEGAVPFF